MCDATIGNMAHGNKDTYGSKYTYDIQTWESEYYVAHPTFKTHNTMTGIVLIVILEKSHGTIVEEL